MVREVQHIEDKYLAIRLNQQQLDEYRRKRREYRSRWVGGGFGINGAIKGAITAGAMNMVTGTAHALFNAGAKILSSISKANKKSDLYRSKGTKDTIYEGIYYSVFYIHAALVDLLRLENKIASEDIEYFIDGSQERAKAIINNFFNMNERDVLDVLSEVILLYPYNKNLYKKALAIFGDKQGELEEIARYFGISDFSDIKENLVEELFLSIKDSLHVSEQQALEVRQIFDKKTREYGYT